jgi:hypothetical protein
MMVDRRQLVVLVLALVALLLRDGSLPHQHLGTDPGLYNHDHDLGTLATVAGALVPDSPEPAPMVVACAPPATPAVGVRALLPRCLADLRAPPRPEPPRNS